MCSQALDNHFVHQIDLAIDTTFVHIFIQNLDTSGIIDVRNCGYTRSNRTNSIQKVRELSFSRSYASQQHDQLSACKEFFRGTSNKSSTAASVTMGANGLKLS